MAHPRRWRLSPPELEAPPPPPQTSKPTQVLWNRDRHNYVQTQNWKQEHTSWKKTNPDQRNPGTVATHPRSPRLGQPLRELDALFFGGFPRVPETKVHAIGFRVQGLGFPMVPETKVHAIVYRV